MSDVSLSKAVRSNLLSLQNTSEMMAKTQDRLASGNKVNSALDNPTNFFTAQGLNSRAGDLNSLMDGMANGIQTIKAADNGLSAITKTLESMQSTLRQARQDKSFQTVSYEAASGTSAGTETISFSDGALDSAATVNLSKSVTGTPTTTPATAATIAGGAFSAIDFSNAGSNDGSITFDLAVDGASATTISITNSDLGGVSDTTAVTATELAGIINSKAGATIASVNGSGNLDFTSTTTGTSSNLTISSFSVTNGATGSGVADTTIVTGTDTVTTPGAATDVFKSVDELVTEINSKTVTGGGDNPLYGKIRASNDNGKLRIENLSTNDLTTTGITSGELAGGSGTSEIAGNTVRADLANQFNELRDQLDKLADDASFNGINLLRGDKLAITFNETGTSSIDIQTKGEKQINSASLNVSTTLTAKDLDSDTNIDAELNKLKSGLNDVRSQSSAFGSNLSIVQNRQDFTKNMINTLQTGAANLTLADMNEEAANLLALQTRQSLSSSSLSLASQADQSVLQLLR